MSDRTRVKGGPGPETIRVLRGALIDRLLPHTYVSAGALVHMETVSGGLAHVADDDDAPLPIAAKCIDGQEDAAKKRIEEALKTDAEEARARTGS
jgi:hypothetical protein